MGLGKDAQRISMVMVFSLNWEVNTQAFIVFIFFVPYAFYK